MKQLSIEERLVRMEENIIAIRQLLESRIPQQRNPSLKEEVKEIMNVKQVSKFIGLDVGLIYEKCTKEQMPYFKIGKQYRFNKEEIVKWLQKQKEGPKISVDEYVNRYLQKNSRKG